MNESLTEADRYALSRMPEGWFSEADAYLVRRAYYRCERLEKKGFLESRVLGEYPNLERQWRKKGDSK